MDLRRSIQNMRHMRTTFLAEEFATSVAGGVAFLSSIPLVGTPRTQEPVDEGMRGLHALPRPIEVGQVNRFGGRVASVPSGWTGTPVPVPTVGGQSWDQLGMETPTFLPVEGGAQFQFGSVGHAAQVAGHFRGSADPFHQLVGRAADQVMRTGEPRAILPLGSATLPATPPRGRTDMDAMMPGSSVSVPIVPTGGGGGSGLSGPESQPDPNSSPFVRESRAQPATLFESMSGVTGIRGAAPPPTAQWEDVGAGLFRTRLEDIDGGGHVFWCESYVVAESALKHFRKEKNEDAIRAANQIIENAMIYGDGLATHVI